MFYNELSIKFKFRKLATEIKSAVFIQQLLELFFITNMRSENVIIQFVQLFLVQIIPILLKSYKTENHNRAPVFNVWKRIKLNSCIFT